MPEIPEEALAQHIEDLVSYAESNPVFVERNKNLELQESYRYCRNAPKIPEVYKETATEMRAPFAYDIVRRAVGLIGSAFPVPRRLPMKEGAIEQAYTSEVEKFLISCFRTMDKRSKFYQRWIDSWCGLGCGVFKCIVDEHLWAEPERKDGESDKDYKKRVSEYFSTVFPFFATHVPTANFYPFYDELGLEKVLIISCDSGARLARKYDLSVDAETGKLRKRQPGDPTIQTYPDSAKFVEYWDRKKWVYTVEGIVVKKGEHKYEEPPIFISSLMADARYNHGEESHGLIWPLMNLQAIWDSLVTIQLQHDYAHGFPYPVLKPTSNDVMPLQDLEITLSHDKVNIPPPGYEFGWTVPPVNTAAVEMRAQIKDIIDQVSLAPILYGQISGETGSATASTLIAVAKSILAPGLKSLAEEWERFSAFILRQCARLQEETGEKVSVYYVDKSMTSRVSLDAKKLNGYYEVTCEHDPILPMERWSKSMYMADLQARGAITMRRLREEGVGINDPEQEDADVWVEEARKTPEYRNTLLKKWLEENIAMQKEKQEQITMQAQATPEETPIGPGGPGVPQMPGVQQPQVSGGAMMTRPEDQVAQAMVNTSGGAPTQGV